MTALEELGVHVGVLARPVEVPLAIPFAEDTEHHAYDPDAMHDFWLALVEADRVLRAFRAGFIGKASPVHFFWGGFDLATTRFSGRPAPKHPGGVPNCADWVMEEAYSNEVSSCGFWPGGGDEGAFYSYAYPEPPGFATAPVVPDASHYAATLGEFILAYRAVRTASDPDASCWPSCKAPTRASQTSVVGIDPRSRPGADFARATRRGARRRAVTGSSQGGRGARTKTGRS